MLHLAAGGVQHDHIQHQRSSPRDRGEPDHPATRHQFWRLSTTTDAAGGRCIDLSELLRVFGPLQTTQQGEGAALLQDAAGERAPPDTLLELLQAQLRDARDREARLLAMLEAEQQARREMEQKLLPAPPRPSSFENGRLGVLLVLFALALAIATVVFFHPDWLR